MALDLSEVKKQLQDHLQDGMLTVVGTGLSMAEGIPGMWDLAGHLTRTVAGHLVGAPDAAWDNVVAALEAGDNLEVALGRVQVLPTTLDAIVIETAMLISRAERAAVDRVIRGQRELPLTFFLKHLFKAGKRFHLITTNYDRLAEVAAEAASIGVDSRFFGYLLGHPDSKRSADCHRESYYSGKNSLFRNLPCLCVYKPHGSLDWFDAGGKVTRCPIGLPTAPIIITPGTSKYRESFKGAFDDQRNAGNRAATSATRLMFIGYGFNDDHLEQYLCPGLTLTKPTVIITKVLSNNARSVIAKSTGTKVLALCACPNNDSCTQILNQSGETLVAQDQLWHLEGFNRGVL